MIKRFASALISAFDLRDIVLVIGLCLMSTGISLVWLPGSLIVPGAILTFVALRGSSLNSRVED